MKGYFIYFTTPYIKDPSCYKSFLALFSPYGEILKLYIDYNHKFGKVYFKEQSAADLAFEKVSLENNYCMKLNPPDIERFLKTVDPNTNMEDEIETSLGTVMYDIYGNEIDALLSDLGEVFVPVNCITKIGFSLYDEKNLQTLQDGNTQIMYDNFKAYLHTQAHIYMNINKIRFKVEDVMKTIDDTITQVVAERNFSTKTQKPNIQKISTNGMSSRLSTGSSDTGEKRILEYPKLDLEIDRRISYKAIITVLLPSDKYWIQLHSNIETYDMIKKEVRAAVLPLNDFLPKEKTICAAFHRDIWQRVYITRQNPIDIQFIDEGIRYKANTSFRPLPERLQKIPGQAIRIKCDDPSESFRRFQLINITAMKQYADSTYLVTAKLDEETFNSNGNGNASRYQQSPRPVQNEANVNRTPTNTRISFTNEDAVKGNTQTFQARNSSNNGEANKENINNTTPSTSSQSKSVEKGIDFQTKFKSTSTSPTTFSNDKIDVKIPFVRKTDAQSENIRPSPTLTASGVVVKKVNQRKNISECLQGTTGYVQCMEKLSATSFIAFIFTLENTSEIEMLEGLENDVNQTNNYAPTLGETVVAKTDVDGVQTCVRATVLEITNCTYKLALIDYGKTITSEKVFSLPENYAKFPEFAALCKGDAGPIQELKIGDCYNMSSSQNFKLKIVYDETTDRIFEATCESIVYDTPVVPAVVEQQIVTLLPITKPLKEKDLVMIINEDAGTLSCRTRESSNILKELIMQMQQNKTAPLTKKPIINQLVLHKFDKDLRRCYVKEINTDTVTVFHIDYGTTAKTSFESLFYIDEYYKFEGTLNYMKLKGFEKGFSKNALAYITKCLKRTKFTVCYIQNEIIDFTNQDGFLSNVLAELDKPAFKTLKDLKYIEIPIGTIPLLALCMDELNEGILKCYTTEDEACSDKFVVLSSDLSQSESGPVPKKLHEGELCIAHFDGEWYRAVVEKVLPQTNEYFVHYLDFGNKANVSLNETRIIEDKYLNLPIMTITCRLKDILDKYNGVIPENVYDKLLEIVETDMYEVNVLSKNGTSYDVNIPSITNQL